MIINGYAYPSISPQILDWWLERITWVSSFSYGFTEKGDLINLADENIVEAAKRYNVRPMMVLTPLDENGAFNDSIAIAVFNDPAARENLINNIETNIRNKGMGVIDFDFEYLSGEYA